MIIFLKSMYIHFEVWVRPIFSSEQISDVLLVSSLRKNHFELIVKLTLRLVLNNGQLSIYLI